MERKVAFVTGASRGIGRAASIALAEQGYDVAVTARTLREGESPDATPLPGSLEITAAEVRRRGREALPIQLDLLDRASLEAAVERTFADWGAIDVLVNNGIYTGPGALVHFLDLTLEQIESIFEANVISQILLTQRVLPRMLERGRGCVINLVSAAGMNDPPAPAGQGGWGFAYAASKAAFGRMVGVLAVEHPDSGVSSFNLQPGFIVTAMMRQSGMQAEFEGRLKGAPPSVPAAVIAWLATDPAAGAWNGRTVSAQKLAAERGLAPG